MTVWPSGFIAISLPDRKVSDPTYRATAKIAGISAGIQKGMR